MTAHEKTHKYISQPIFFVVLILMLFTGQLKAEKPQMLNEISISTGPPKAVVIPKVIVSLNNGRLLVGGRLNSRQQAWASMIDRAGQVVWEYSLGPKYSLPIGSGAEFNDAVALSDGTILLCGNMPRPPGTFTPGLVVRLDERGHLLREQYISPAGGIEYGIVGISKCLKVHENTVLIGAVSQFFSKNDPQQKLLPDGKHFYWIVCINSNGDKVWETEIPTSFDTIDNIGPPVLDVESRIIFSSVRLDHTEVFSISSRGDRLSSSKFAGSFIATADPPSSDNLHFFGSNFTGKNLSMILDRELKKVGEVAEIEGLSNFALGAAYQLADKSFLLSGLSYKKLAGRYVSGIAVLDHSTNDVKNLNFLDSPLADIGIMTAISRINELGDFVIGRSIAVDLRQTLNTPGIALSFIQVK